MASTSTYALPSRWESPSMDLGSDDGHRRSIASSWTALPGAGLGVTVPKDDAVNRRSTHGSVIDDDNDHRHHHPQAQLHPLRSPVNMNSGVSTNGKPIEAPSNSAVAYAPVNGYKPRSRSGTASAYGHPWYAPEVAHLREHTSPLTRYLLTKVQSWPLLHSILAEKDSRRIFYFMSLNFVFMLVQTFYGITTGSLGLLSDSIHMLFDCLALLVGLAAAVMSKWPPSLRFPYGLSKMDTLAGFANGIFLMLISIEIVTEAVERLVNGAQMKRIGELLIVSVLGLCVNLVGIMAFDHAHAHPGHGHVHEHSHETDHRTYDSHHYHHHHHHPKGHQSPVVPSSSGPNPTHSHGHHHHHGNDNMRGIFLHILADTLGSVAVVISSLLIHFYSWPGFDPVASCIIAILIFISAIPLVASSAKSLLLTIPADTEYSLRETLIGVSALRGVACYRVPKFWLDESEESKREIGGGGVLGVIHIIVNRAIDMDEVRQRVVDYLRGRRVDAVVQVEREGESRCWCTAGLLITPSGPFATATTATTTTTATAAGAGAAGGKAGSFTTGLRGGRLG